MFDLTLATALINSVVNLSIRLEDILVFVRLSVPRLFFVIKKVKMNPNVFKFARRPCALVLVFLSHVSDNEE